MKLSNVRKKNFESDKSIAKCDVGTVKCEKK